LKQITFAAALMIIGTSILTKQLYTIMKHEAWIATAAGVLICILLFLVYSSIAKRFPGFSLIEINDIVFGRVLGKSISIIYIYFFFTIACLNVNVMGNLIKNYVLQNSPNGLFMAIFVAVCCFAVRKGPVNLMRYGVLLTILSFIVLMIITTLLIPKMDFKRLLPFFVLPAQNYAIGTHSIAMVPLSDPFVLMMYLPHIKNADGFGKAITRGLLVGGLFMLVIILRDLSVLGPVLADFSLPSLISVRQIDVGDILTRIDIFYFTIIIMLLFYKVSLLFYAAADGLRRLLKTEKDTFLIHILGVLLIVYALTVFRSAEEHAAWLVNGAAHIQHTFIVVVLPVATLVTAALRGMTKGAARAAAATDINPAGGGDGVQ
jgi:spore germination protein KB